MSQDPREQLSLGGLFEGQLQSKPADKIFSESAPLGAGDASTPVSSFSFSEYSKKKQTDSELTDSAASLHNQTSQLPTDSSSSHESDAVRKEEKVLAPMLQHYKETKRKYPEHLLLFQVGDFYEIFFEDAHLASELLGIRLTSRNKDNPDAIPMCGVPIHALDNYLPRILRAGRSCVLMSQVEDRSGKKGAVTREISRIITPGVRYEGDGLDERSYNFLLALFYSSRGAGSLAFTDVSTGILRVVEVESIDELLDMIQRVAPSEMILPSVIDSLPVDRYEPWLKRARTLAEESGIRVVFRPFERPKRDLLSGRLRKLSSGNPPDFCERISVETSGVLGALLDYVEDISFGNMPPMSEMSFLESGKGLVLDSATRRNLELTETRIDGERKNSLLARIDATRTAMGARQLREWVLSPSTSLPEIVCRQDVVEELISQSEVLENFREMLLGVRDIDRLLTRVSTHRATPYDLGSLRDSLKNFPRFGELLQNGGASEFKRLAGDFDSLSDVWQRLSDLLVDEPPIKLLDGGIIRTGVHEELDRLKRLGADGNAWLLELEQRERQATGISVLKVKYNNVFGYFIEVTKTHLEKIPAHYERRQTLVNAERFVTRELKEFEQEVLSAKSRQIELERELFTELRRWVGEQVSRIQRSARVISTIDVFCSFAQIARMASYVRPCFVTDRQIMEVRSGRHPVVEQVLGQQNFVANDIRLDGENRRFAVLTGPNMGGKSTYLRQIGLIQLLAQAGSFVPATSAVLSVVDRIFTRIGAADDLARGDSTFMMEMREAAIIAKKATNRSLVLVDELGRGTATIDGLAIARAIAEWLHDVVRCTAVFATHFHELNDLKDGRDGIFCLSVGVVEKGNDITFTHRIEEHAADRSYGLEVAELAGLPRALLSRAQEIFRHLTAVEQRAQEEQKTQATVDGKGKSALVLFDRTHTAEIQKLETIRERIAQVDISSTTPLEALIRLEQLKDLVSK